MVGTVVENNYHLDVFNNDQSQMTKEQLAQEIQKCRLAKTNDGVVCPKVPEKTDTCNTLNGWQISEIVTLTLVGFNVLCHWSNITHWIYATCLAHRTRLTEKKEKKLSVEREKMREELRQEQVLVAPPEPGPAAQQPRQILGPAQPEIVVELGGGQGA